MPSLRGDRRSGSEKAKVFVEFSHAFGEVVAAKTFTSRLLWMRSDTRLTTY